MSANNAVIMAVLLLVIGVKLAGRRAAGLLRLIDSVLTVREAQRAVHPGRTFR